MRARRVVLVSLAWAITGGLDALNTYAITKSDLVDGEANYEWQHFLLVKLGMGALAGLLFGGVLIFFLRERARNRPFGVALLINSTIVAILNFGMVALTYNYILEVEYNHTAFFLRTLVLWMLVSVLTVIFLHVNDKYGRGIFIKLLLGEYHHPSQEERIFMFVDIKSSTTIAEQLGHIRFFELLNDFFRDITNSIIYSKGEVYQYVGDQVVISWTMKNGLNNANCVRCFYNMLDAIQKNAGRYRRRYNLVPEFKAGLHCGPVTTGEIGVIKKDIVYSGDVLNTTARIESLCNLYKVRMLISKYLLDKLLLPPNVYIPTRVGIIELKGKRQKVELYAIENPNQRQLESTLHDT